MAQVQQTVARITCDSCKYREASGQCKCCGQDLCRICEALIPGCQINPFICKKCYSNVEVAKLIHKSGDKIKKIRDRRDKELEWIGRLAREGS